MKIYVDADACPVVEEIEKIAKRYEIDVILLCDTNHVLRSRYSQVIVVDAGADRVDFALLGKICKGDLAITQDYGLAAMVLSKGAYGLHPNGMEYRDEMIDALLAQRHFAQEQRRRTAKNHMKGPKKRSALDDQNFCEALERIILAHGFSG